jgi:hypothetical protein
MEISTKILILQVLIKSYFLLKHGSIKGCYESDFENLLFGGSFWQYWDLN